MMFASSSQREEKKGKRVYQLGDPEIFKSKSEKANAKYDQLL